MQIAKNIPILGISIQSRRFIRMQIIISFFMEITSKLKTDCN